MTRLAVRGYASVGLALLLVLILLGAQLQYFGKASTFGKQ